MQVTVIAPDRAVFEGEADSMIAPAYDGLVGIEPRHAPFMTLLGEGRLTIKQGDETHTFTVQGGFLQVIHDHVRVVAERAENETQ